MRDFEQADALGRAVEGGAFDEAGTSYKLGRALSGGRSPASTLEEEDLLRREVERFLGERLKADTFSLLYYRFKGYKDLVGGYVAPDARDGWWAMLAADRSCARRHESWGSARRSGTRSESASASRASRASGGDRDAE